MKKLIRSIAITLAAVLVFGMTVFAATSPIAQQATTLDTILAEQAQQIANDTVNVGNGQSYTIGNLSEIWLVRMQRYADAHGLGKVLTVFDLSSSATNVNVTLRFKDLSEGKSYVFLHYIGANWQDDSKYDENAYEVIGTTVSDKFITGFFKNFSPVGIVEGSASAASAVVAPKTGEIIALSAIMALIMIAGAVVCAKKARLQK